MDTDILNFMKISCGVNGMSEFISMSQFRGSAGVNCYSIDKIHV